MLFYQNKVIPSPLPLVKQNSWSQYLDSRSILKTVYQQSSSSIEFELVWLGPLRRADIIRATLRDYRSKVVARAHTSQRLGDDACVIDGG
jgi:hypothetical protein